MTPIGKMVLVSLLAAVAVGIAVGVPAMYFPSAGPPLFPQQFLHVDTVLSFTDNGSVPVVTVSGDTHVNITASWRASSGTWQWLGASNPSTEPACFPRCGNASMSGSFSFPEDFCTTWPGGGTNYWDNETNITIYMVFFAEPDVADVVWLHMTVITSASIVCA